ncbi:MAG TPA: IS1380 family transposase [Streptosporangiaceae bacterium]|nr:IS1380 family transposase [Streptosporangiaceae bacterium]
MRLLHTLSRTSAVFDDPNLVSHGGLVPVMALAERAGLPELLEGHVRPGGECGVNAHLKAGCLVAGMAAGADSIDDMGLLRHGAMDVLFGGVRAPSTLGSHLRCYAWGNVLQIEKAGRELLARLPALAPLLPGADVLAFVDIDSTQKRVYGHKKEGARFGHTKIQGKSVLVRGLNALIGAVSTPLAAPVIAATRLRGGNASSARGAASLAAQAIGTARACGATGTIVVRMDSAYYTAAVIAAVRRNEARFSVTAPVSAAIRAAITTIPQDAWQPIEYPQAIWDDQLDCWVSDAEVAETPYAAFTSKNKELHVTARLIVRRVRDKATAAPGQGELFPAWRYHAVFTDSPFELVQAEEQHRGHAVIEQLLADLNDGPLAHLPSGKFTANAAWLAIAAIAHNLVRAAGALAGRRHARARTATIRRDLIAVAGRTARHGRGRLTIHLPEGWHRAHEWLNLWEAACGPPTAAA